MFHSTLTSRVGPPVTGLLLLSPIERILDPVTRTKTRDPQRKKKKKNTRAFECRCADVLEPESHMQVAYAYAHLVKLLPGESVCDRSIAEAHRCVSRAVVVWSVPRSVL